MREDICTIPINDVFLPKDGCPLCRMRDMLEERSTVYITGAAMMEPDVRIKTNEKGFCFRHFSMMLKCGTRLSNALILESHLDKLKTEMIPKTVKGKPDKKKIAAIRNLQKSCFVCEQVEWGMAHMYQTIFSSYATDSEFKALYNSQQFICMEHYADLLTAAANKGIPSKILPDFYSDTAKLAGGYLEILKDDVTHFCSMFDYRSKGQDWGNSKDAIERSIEFLTSERVTKDDAQD
ncbi:MAG: hypothetical protein II685_03810 [Clostridia bacterium]|nr:hypothetical protein [Clostridia bacterium]